ncbi:MAG: AbrB/MazE/SpoVT family DNA-binding domain-containing protein [Cyclobacteriaceae bacterium]
MIVKLTKIGNSKGVRIPKEFIEGLEEGAELDLSRKGDQLVLTPKIKSRKNWVEQIKQAEPDSENDFIINDFDDNEWEWK